jgi:hypothetical protein
MKRNVWHTFRRNQQPPWRRGKPNAFINFKFLSIYTAFRPGGHCLCYWQCHVNKIFFPVLDSLALKADLYKSSTTQFILVYWVLKLDGGEEQGNLTLRSYMVIMGKAAVRLYSVRPYHIQAWLRHQNYGNICYTDSGRLANIACGFVVLYNCLTFLVCLSFIVIFYFLYYFFYISFRHLLHFFMFIGPCIVIYFCSKTN